MAEYVSREDARRILCDVCGCFHCDTERCPFWQELDKLPVADVIEADAMTIYGYHVKPLVLFAAACRNAGVSDKDLKNFTDNLEFAYKVIRDEQMKMFNKCMSKFCSDTIKIEPEALRREDGAV